jgi:hypothetical protein
VTDPFSVNWSALRKTAEDATKPLPEGKYNVTVVKSEFKTATTGSLMIVTTLEVDDGPAKGRRLFTNFVLAPDSPFALSMFFRNMAAFGLDEAFFNSLQQSGMSLEASMSQIAATLQNRSAQADVGIRTWQGQERNECKTFTPKLGGGPAAPGAAIGPATLSGPAAPSVGSAVPTATPTSPTQPSVPGPPPPPEPAF